VTPGRHTVSWDGRDDDGRQLGSGVYYYRFEAAGAARIGKMVLLR
jgi:flagellar hook assembly protein FlgD